MRKKVYRFGAFVITYNRPSILHNTINAVLSQSHPPEHILVVDNGDSDTTLKTLADFDPERIAYHSMGGNTGPAGATAYALRRLATEQYDWIYWVDDDDPPQTADTLERLLAMAESVDDTRIGGMGVVGSVFDWRLGEMRRLNDAELTGVIDVDVIAGNQQFILNRRMIENVGVADSRLFFGLYEPEYCLRIRRSGFRLLVDGDMMRDARVRANRLNLQRKRAWVPDYPPSRIWQRYYRTRNYIFMMRRTFGRPDLARREMKKALARSITAWARGLHYGARFTPLQLQGIIDGYRDRMGRTVMPAPKYKT